MKLNDMLKRGFSLVTIFALSVMTAVCAFATGESDPVTADTVMNSLTSGLTSAQSYSFQGINNALPLALGLAGVIIAVTIGWRLFKRMGK